MKSHRNDHAAPAAGNLNIVMALTPAEQTAVEWFRQAFIKDKDSAGGVEGMAHLILRTVLAHPKEVKAMINAYLRYFVAEGFAVEQASNVVMARLTQPKEYRRIKRAAGRK